MPAFTFTLPTKVGFPGNPLDLPDWSAWEHHWLGIERRLDRLLREWAPDGSDGIPNWRAWDAFDDYVRHAWHLYDYLDHDEVEVDLPDKSKQGRAHGIVKQFPWLALAQGYCNVSKHLGSGQGEDLLSRGAIVWNNLNVVAKWPDGDKSWGVIAMATKDRLHEANWPDKPMQPSGSGRFTVVWNEENEHVTVRVEPPVFAVGVMQDWLRMLATNEQEVPAATVNR